MKAILRSINNFSCKLKQSNNLKYNISPKIRSNKFKNISGNGNVVIEDALNKDLKDYKVYGNTYQNSTSGKNLLGITANSNNGITSVINSDGSITYSGTATSTWANITQRFYKDLPSGTYTLSINKVMDYRVAIRLYYEDGTYQPFVIYAGDTSRIFTATQNIKSYYIYISNALTVGQEYNDTLYVQLEEGSTATEFEPYTGGQPSPNPDYPQEMVSCGDRTKNLFDINEYSNAILRGGGSAIDFTKENDTTLKILNKISQVNNFCGIPIPNSENLLGKTITASAKTELNNVNNTKMQFFFLSGSAATAAIGTAKPITSNGTYQLTATIPSSIPSGSTRIGLVIYGSNTAQPVDSYVLWENIQIEENSSATPYEPYGYKIPVNVRSENLFNNNDTSILLKAYISPTTLVSNNNSTTLFVNCKPNTTYTITRSIIGKRFGVGTTDIIPVVGDSINNVKPSNVNNELSTITYTTNSTAKYLCVFYSNTGGNNLVNNNGYTEEELRNSLQIVEGSTVPSKYIPYYNETTNIYLDEPLRKIDEYSDYIDFINGKVVRKIYEYKITGNENWKKQYGINLFDVQSLFNNNPFINEYGLSNMYKYNPIQSGIDTNTVHGEFALQRSIRGTTRSWNLFIKNTSYSDKDLFKTYLQNLYNNNTPVVINYPLGTPTVEDIELPNINLIEGKNIITIGTELESIIEVEYYSKEIIDISNYKYDLRKVED